jgi:hypothetical protein
MFGVRVAEDGDFDFVHVILARPWTGQNYTYGVRLEKVIRNYPRFRTSTYRNDIRKSL